MNLIERIKNGIQNARADSWANLITGVGASRGRVGSFAFTPLATDYLDEGTLELLYDLDGIAARVVRAVPQHALREGFAVTTGDAATDTSIAGTLDDLGAVVRLRRAWTWARLYGGGAVVIGADDGRDPSEPLDWSNVRSVRYLVDVSRRELVPQQWNDDPLSARYSTPEVYLLTRIGVVGSRSLRVHATRVIRFDGAETTTRRKAELQGWGDSVLQRVYQDLRTLRSGDAAVAELIQSASQGVFKIKNLFELMTGDGKDVFRKRMELMDMCRSVARSVLLDVDESYERVETAALTGLPDVLDRFAERVSASSEIPLTVLMGRSPAGMNATGESDVRGWYDAVAAERNAILKPRVEYLVRVLLLAKNGPTKGAEPSGWKATFPPLWQPTQTELADLRGKVATQDATYIEKGVLTAEEVAVNRFRKEGWSMETAIDLGARNAAMEADASDPTTTDEAADHDQVMAVIARVASREIPRDSGLALLAKLGLSAEDAEATMGETGRSFFTKPDPAAVTELDALRAENAKLKASNEGHKAYTARVIQKAKEGGLELGAFTAKAPTETNEGDTLEEGDVVAVPAATGVQDARALLRADGGRGVAVVLPLPAAVAVEMAATGGERPEDLHLTLAYVCPSDGAPLDLLATLRAVVATWAASTAPMAATLGGIGRFFASGDELDPVYLSVDAPCLSNAREALVRGLSSAGVKVSKEHGFVPHVTLAYVPQTTGITLSNNPNQPNTTLTFTEVAVWSGDARESFPLGGTQEGGA